MRLMPLMLAFVFVLAACGGFENAPLEQGWVKGRLVGADATASVALLGLPDVGVALSDSPDFNLGPLQQGDVELIAIASPTHALRFTATVVGGQIVELGALQPKKASYVKLQVSAVGGESVAGAQGRVVGTRLESFTPAADGTLRVGPLPRGCYTVNIACPGLGMMDRAECVGDDGDDLDDAAEFDEPDGGSENEGCRVTGCTAGLRCDDGRCR
jgi:S1-C subfamily serine protease